ncbi:DNA-binding protein [bacterium (Candidatus Blackallbacteria) CG17_big_fil_post_rev_8_21_14_2_50_48_46]|uniref:DNA-binding protein n=1 Tax=bacterium (Candidatus Blackallbacteria) CG17_big_fil_post_rev_8_21_14_2_50_48_46 TaxID=2014261 RepID=A0A2M7G5I1_9BACT|nr:MAG: DNA-binding protein [bacterium (Candidatus Blackallbacteria) CG18_big_fil_WC_8_21_14_2_50_49_26]PIW16834.1 MAG: DNA-binding protein [bacterium (Candidatus Blackallbacteria) CG17_big_fil_post_rev_8_21_14_2_50_48_46]PIW48031.1 MAG: DNA-binding protein [bacterium (Candidatus Blackallbacteria) CG13_big_fil_rev_8_21_14_2_50_49_14]
MPTDFRLKQFWIRQQNSPIPMGTDALLLGSWVESEQPQHILDIGTGTGILALMQAQKYPQAQIEALEPEPQAAEQAQENFKASAWEERLQLRQLKLQDYRPERAFDLILSNPPYFEPYTLSPEPARARGRSSLDLSWKDILAFAKDGLTPQGQLALILPAETETTVRQAAQAQGFYLNALCRVSGQAGKKPIRILMSWQKMPSWPREQTLSIREGKVHSTAYLDLVKDFFPGSL